MQQKTGDFALFFRRETDKLVALSGSYVDDVIQAGTKKMRRTLQDSIKFEFEIATSEMSRFIFTGLLCDFPNPNLHELSQSHCVNRLRLLSRFVE